VLQFQVESSVQSVPWQLPVVSPSVHIFFKKITTTLRKQNLAMSAEALELAWRAAWQDFLSNKVDLARKRAEPWLQLLPDALASADDSDLLVTLGDLAHISGAAGADETMLRDALRAYDAHLALEPTNSSALRMVHDN
jgi:hypothetical protein